MGGERGRSVDETSDVGFFNYFVKPTAELFL